MYKTIGIAWVHKTAFSAMRTEADAKFPKESGGILVGYWANSSREVIVTNVIGPGYHAVHQDDSFVPDAEYQNEQLATLYKESGRLLSYLGDWHSHPNGEPHLSRIDLKALKIIANTPQARVATPLMAIMAHGDPWSLAVWQAIPRRVGRLVIAVKVRPLAVRLYYDA
jgi:integrative and conjugative element protein (TIGR02256 family)